MKFAFDIGDACPTEFDFQQSWIDHTTLIIARLLLELVDAVRARHVTPVISIYCIVAAEPYFAGFRSA
jgi:hypothetical protein